jgi:hypothetical protein
MFNLATQPFGPTKGEYYNAFEKNNKYYSNQKIAFR